MRKNILLSILVTCIVSNLHSQKKFSNRKIDNLKNQVQRLVDEDKKMTQVMIDKVFSFGELGFQ